ncbi:MAG TPA: adenylate/guanylate cyclase domain-containing protein [Dehalococcoidia bacterium]
MAELNIQYTKTADGAGIAYAILGRGRPLVRMGPIVTSFAADWGGPGYGPSLRRLAEHHQLVMYDGRGCGLSQRDATDFSLEARIKDLDAVVRATGEEVIDLWAYEWSAPVAVAYAVQNPETVRHLILEGGFGRAADVATREQIKALIDLCRTNWRLGSRTLAHVAHPTRESDGTISMGLLESFRDAIDGDGMAEWFTQAYEMDVTDLLSQIEVPTLVLHRRGDRVVRFALGQELAARIPNSRFVPLEGDDAAPTAEQFEEQLAAVGNFLGTEMPSPGPSVPRQPSTGIATILFTDLVGHTEMMQRLGDDKGRDVLREHDRITREVLAAHDGAEVKTMGDGFMASFGSVTRAVECAVALQQAFAEREGEPLSVRVGLNAGEPIEEDGDLFGATVILASRIAAKAEGGEILVSDNVRSLSAGKGFLFADRGEFVAKGFEEPVRVYEVRWQE